MTLDMAAVAAGIDARPFEVTANGEIRPAALSVAALRQPFSSFTVDSRTVRDGSLFVALPGRRVDGNDFVAPALRAGARGCLVSRLPAGLQVALPAIGIEPVLFLTVSPLKALQQLARYWRSLYGGTVIGVTGSIGKTTTREIIASMLASRWPVLRSEANLNTEIGLPLEVLRLSSEHRAAVFEMGMYAPGDIALLAAIADPHIGVVTNVAPIHLERMGTVERIAGAKSELVAALPSSGLAILNGDDSWTRAMAETSGTARTLLVGHSPDCDYRIVDNVSRGLNGMRFLLRAEGRAIPIESSVPGEHTLIPLACAAAIARELGMEWDEIERAARGARVDIRQRIVPGPGGLAIIDDSYNASPPSMRAALSLLAASPGTKVAVLGDMLELGAGEEAAHREIGRLAAQLADWLILRGDRVQWLAGEARAVGMPAERIMLSATNKDAVRLVQNIMGQGQTGEKVTGTPDAEVNWSVLVKGSRDMKMEEVVQGLRVDRC